MERFAAGVCVVSDAGSVTSVVAVGVAARGRAFELDLSAGERRALELDTDETTTSCLAYDEDGDGDDDLVLGTIGGLVLFRNAAGSWERSEALDGLGVPWPQGLAAGDVDRDGDLDLLVAGYLDPSPVPEDAVRCPRIPCALSVPERAPIPSRLLTREADGAYVDRTELAPDLALAEPTLVLAFAPIDGVPGAEIFVGNDLPTYHDRVLRRDADGVYRDAALELAMRTNQRGSGVCTMGFAAGDIDADGDLDFAASSYQLDPSAIYLCDHELGACPEEGVMLGALGDSFRWGMAIADFDGDGRADLFEATGHLYTAEETVGVAAPGEWRQPANLYFGTLDGLVRHVPEPGDAMAVPRAARGIATADVDDDGRLDVILATMDGPVVLMNQTEPHGHFLRVRLVGRGLDREGAGALVTVRERDGGAPHVRARLVGEGYAGSGDRRLFFGLRNDQPVDIEVVWSDGARTEASASVDRTVEVLR